MAEKKRTWGQIRADKERQRKEAKGGSDGVLDARICFRVNTEMRDLSWRVHTTLGLTQGELFRSLLEEKAQQLGLTPMELAR